MPTTSGFRPCGVPQPESDRDPLGAIQGRPDRYLRDPDGISIELMQEPPGGPNFDDKTDDHDRGGD